MKTYIVEYMSKLGAIVNKVLVSAKDYTGAYLAICYSLPMGAIILGVFEVK